MMALLLMSVLLMPVQAWPPGIADLLMENYGAQKKEKPRAVSLLAMRVRICGLIIALANLN